MTFIQENLDIIGEINIKETGQTVSVSKSSIKRDMIKRGDNDTNNQVYAEFKQLFENAKYKGFREADERHKGKVKGQDIFLSKMELDGKIYNVEFMADAPIAEAEKDKLYYAGHKIITLGGNTEMTPLHTESDDNLQKTAENNNQDGDVKYSRADNADNTNAKQDGQKAETEKPITKVNFSKKARQFLDSKDAIKKLFETAKKMNLTPKDIYTHARLNAGNIGRATAALEQGTFSIDENGNINWNGESLKAIMNDFSKVLNVSAKQANQDINDYLIAVRYLADLRGTDVAISQAQMEKAMTARAHRALLRLRNAA